MTVFVFLEIIFSWLSSSKYATERDHFSFHGRVEFKKKGDDLNTILRSWPYWIMTKYKSIPSQKFFFIYLFFILTLQKIHDFISHVYHYDIFFWIDLFYFAKTFFFWLKNTTKNSGNRVYRLNLFDLVAIPAWSWRTFHVF